MTGVLREIRQRVCRVPVEDLSSGFAPTLIAGSLDEKADELDEGPHGPDGRRAFPAAVNPKPTYKMAL